MKEPNLMYLLTNKKKVDTEYLLMYIAIQIKELKECLKNQKSKIP